MELTPIAYWLNTALAPFDEGITTAVHQLYYSAGGFFTPFFEFVSLLGKGGIFLIMLSFVLIYFKKTRKYGIAMLLSVTVGAIFTNLFIKIVVARPRPYADPNGFFYPLWLTVGQNIESDKSFPSGHTTAAFATMTAVFLVGNKKYSWTAYIFAFAMGVARIYLVVHYPTDVVGGIIVGTLAGFIGTAISRKLPEQFFVIEFLDYLPAARGAGARQGGAHLKK